MHLTREEERRIGGGSPILPWILMVQDIAFASIYTRASPRYIALLISSPNKKGFTAEDNGPSLSRFDFEADRIDRISLRASQKNLPPRLRWYFISPLFCSPFPFFWFLSFRVLRPYRCDKIAITSFFSLFRSDLSTRFRREKHNCDCDISRIDSELLTMW